MATLIFPWDGGEAVWRDYTIEGNSATPRWKPKKSEIRELTAFYQDTFQDHEDRLLVIEDEIGTGIPTEGFDAERVQPHTDFAFWTGTILKCAAPISVSETATNGRYQLSGGAVMNWDCELAFDIRFASQLGARDRSRLPLVGDMFVDWNTGNDADSGTSISAAKKTVDAAYPLISAIGGTIWIMPGVNHDQMNVAKSDNLAGGFARPVKIKAFEGPGSVLFVGPGQTPAEATWTPGVGFSYTATPTGGLGVVRFFLMRLPDGTFEELPFYADQATLQASTNWGWTQNDGTGEVTVRVGGQAMTDPEVAAKFFFAWSENGHNFLSTRTYIEGLDFVGGGPIRVAIETSGDERGEVYIKDCAKHFTSSSGLRNEGCITIADGYQVNGTWFGDGFSYTVDLVDGVLEADGAEIRSVAIRCGSQKSDQGSPSPVSPATQGSSMHSKGTILRINSWYENNFGASTADAGEAVDGAGKQTRAWMVGCVMGDPWVYWDNADTSPQPIAGNPIDAGYVMISGEAWIDTCRIAGMLMPNAVQMIGTPVATINVFRVSAHGTSADYSGGTPNEYRPDNP